MTLTIGTHASGIAHSDAPRNAGTYTVVAHFALDTEEGALRAVRAVLGFLPASAAEQPPVAPAGDPADREARRAV